MFKRASSWIALILVASLALQWFFYTGIFLMFLGASIWTGWLFLLLLVAIVAEAMTGKLPKIALTLPIVVVVGYYGSVVGQRIAISDVVAKTASSNAEELDQTLVRGHDLLFQLSGALGNDLYAVSALMSKYDLSTTYMQFSKGNRGYLQRLTVASQCGPQARPWEMPDFGYGTLSLCIDDDLPLDDNGKIVVKSSRSSAPLFGTELISTTYTATLDGSALGTGGAVKAALWPYVPQVLMGCGLVSGGTNAGWRCAVDTYPKEQFSWPAHIKAKRFSLGDEDLSPIAEKLGLAVR